jgi:O-antigen/teichoic acid export membrane protein
MSKQLVQGIAKNTGFMFVQQVITWASTFLLMIFLPRYLGPKEYGTVFLGTSIGAIFGIIVSYGGNYYVAKSVSRDPTRTAQIMIDASAFRIVLWIVAFLGSIVFCKVANYSWHERTVIFIFVGALGFQGPSLVMYSCFQGRERMEFTSRGMIVEKIFVSVVGILALLGGAGAVTIAFVMILGSFLNFLIMGKYSRVIAPSLPRVNWQSALSEMKAGIPYFMFMAFSSIYYRINSVILSKTVSGEVLGWFGAAMRFFETMNFFPFIITTAIYPVFSRLWKNEASTYQKASLLSLEFILMVGFPVCLLIFLFAQNIVAFFYGMKQYSASIPILQVLASGAIFLFVNMILGTVLISSDRQRQQTYLTFGAIPVSIALNLFLIPYTQRYYGNGGIGAALATVIVEMLVMITMLKMAPQGSFKGFQLLKLLKIAAATSVSGLCAYILREIGFFWIASAFVGIIIYIPVLRKIRGIGDDEWAMAKDLMKTLPYARYLSGSSKKSEV